MTDSARSAHPDRPTADRWWRKLSPFDAVVHIATRLDSLLAGVEDDETLGECLEVAAVWMRDLHDIRAEHAKQGEAYEEALAYARSLYRDGLEPTTAELAETVRSAFWVAPEKMPVQNAALSELVKRAAGHVPVESFAAAMTALEAAEKERDEANDLVRDLAKRPPRERSDRLAAALERLIHTAEWLLEPRREQDEHRSAPHADAYAALDAAREALNPGDGE